MIRWFSLAFAIALTLLLTFLAASASGIAWLEDPMPLLDGTRPVAATIGVLLLVVDVFLPIPSVLVMVAHGALFGVAGGTILSLVGSTAAALTGFAVGRAGNTAVRRIVTPEEHQRAGELLRRWGVLAIVVSRPVPILAETVAILAGSSPLTWRQTAVASAAGSLVPSLAYAWAGAHASDVASQVVIFAGLIVVTTVLWLVGRRFSEA